ncbi:unnamed protein product [Miscanthus lutarioriparius]|uniref:Uncharacterized protein n=1 Tax=Miscanthus lutarioriparius TaxID=422564 RepID=A0A811PEI6_9POAL|nr:unnamed protein product [Miscanthus lutarioriparius]
MEMKKIACAVLVAASATVALAAEAPAPAPTSGSSAVAPAVGAALGAAVASFFAYYIHSQSRSCEVKTCNMMVVSRITVQLVNVRQRTQMAPAGPAPWS